MKKLRIALGESDFRTIRERDYFYLDKSLFMEELWEEPSPVLIFPRPRRFGKTTNLSMLRYFFDNLESERNARLFEKLKIASKPEIMEHQGKYPVIYLTLKEAKEKTYEEFLENMGNLLSEEFKRHQTLLEGDLLLEKEKEDYYNILNERSNALKIKKSLFDLTKFLQRRYEKKVVVLIDEYDTPMHHAYQRGYFDDMADFMGGFLGSVLKDNPYLEKGVITGILQVARESIFSELNNPSIFNLFQTKFAERFGFTEQEVESFLKQFGLENYAKGVKDNYNGYLIGRRVIYNPWSILKWAADSEHEFIPFWLGTSSNDLVRDLIIKEDSSFMEEDLEQLLLGKPITCDLLERLTLRDMKGKRKVIWSLFLFSGYLKPHKMKKGTKTNAELIIPNLEVKTFFQETVKEWLETKRGTISEDLQKMLRFLVEGKIKEFGPLFQEWMIRLLSYHDTAGRPSAGTSSREEYLPDNSPERVYHAFLLGLLASLESDYVVESNAESGLGRFDLMLIPNQKSEIGIVIEIKKREQPGNRKFKEVEFDEAMEQIKTKDYSAKLRKHRITKILNMAMLFQGKQVWIKSQPLSDFGHSTQICESPYSPPPEEENFDFAQEFDLLLAHFEKFQKLAVILEPNLEKKLDKIEDKLHDIVPTQDKSQIPTNVLSRLRQLLKSPEIQNQSKIKKERKALKSSYEKIARWLGLPV